MQRLRLCRLRYKQGFTISRDGWRFEPVPGEVARFLCRGQVIPDGPHTLEYEIFVEDVVDGPIPEVYAALLCKSDGFKVFQCRRFGLRLVPDFPLTTKQEFLKEDPVRFVGPEGSDVRGDHEAMLSCAWGRPSDAFGKMFTRYDVGQRKCPRLPGPPYHFVSSVLICRRCAWFCSLTKERWCRRSKSSLTLGILMKAKAICPSP